MASQQMHQLQDGEPVALTYPRMKPMLLGTAEEGTSYQAGMNQSCSALWRLCTEVEGLEIGPGQGFFSCAAGKREARHGAWGLMTCSFPSSCSVGRAQEGLLLEDKQVPGQQLCWRNYIVGEHFTPGTPNCETVISFVRMLFASHFRAVMHPHSPKGAHSIPFSHIWFGTNFFAQT